MSTGYSILKATRSQPDIDQLSPDFGFVHCLRFQHALYHTTQFVTIAKKMLSTFLAANASWLNEVVATEAYSSDTPALNAGPLGYGGT
jgi:hypothetical protein